ncbi:hypothetical protein D3C80_1994140 [compost metagenome]
MNNRDLFTRYMLLYGILYFIYRSQPKVDEFIWSTNNNEKEYKSTLKKKKEPETIYTYLRNQVGHTQKNSDLNEVVKQMSIHVNQLMEYVKKAIKKKLL